MERDDDGTAVYPKRAAIPAHEACFSTDLYKRIAAHLAAALRIGSAGRECLERRARTEVLAVEIVVSAASPGSLQVPGLQIGRCFEIAVNCLAGRDVQPSQ
jgi:hypothetical protein